MKRIVFIIAVVALGLITVTACGQKKEKKNMTENKTLVAYFSATGTTESLAKKIATATGGELYKITPEAEYSAEDLDWTVETSRCCKENADPSSRPAFVKTKENLDAYDVVYLGFPNWWNGAPRIINTFIEAYGLKGKTVILFMTSGGSGIQNSLKVLGKQYPEVNFKTGKLLNGASQKTVDNLSSLQIHHHLGFCQVSRFSEVGRKFGRWLDVIDLELIL